ncbi:hypothetical protein VXQ18_13390 [Brucella abortus]|nr:hypothetical protein [Brucella abortus]
MAAIHGADRRLPRPQQYRTSSPTGRSETNLPRDEKASESALAGPRIDAHSAHGALRGRRHGRRSPPLVEETGADRDPNSTPRLPARHERSAAWGQRLVRCRNMSAWSSNGASNTAVCRLSPS